MDEHDPDRAEAIRGIAAIRAMGSDKDSLSGSSFVLGRFSLAPRALSLVVTLWL
jgi:hypothetical protein